MGDDAASFVGNDCCLIISALGQALRVNVHDGLLTTMPQHAT